jgi:hypothetical protein
MFFFSDIKQLQESWLYPDLNFSPVRHEDREEALSQESPVGRSCNPQRARRLISSILLLLSLPAPFLP